MNVKKTAMSNVTTQTDFVQSPILLQCLYVLQTVPEFRNLTYRVTKTQNGVEMIAIYREEVLGVFGPPVDPITLMLDPKGKCLLSIPFKPVQRVSIVSPESGHIVINSLLAVLRMIAGKGYLFCPGLPERFLAGKACGKFVVLHKIPFKRYQSSECPVYYQPQVLQQKSTKSSLCALCPRCMQVAKWIHSLPVFTPNDAGKVAQRPAQLTVVNQCQPDQRNTIHGSFPGINVVTQEVDSTGTTSPASFSRHLFHNSVTQVPVGQILNINLSHSKFSQKTSVDVNGNSQAALVKILKDNGHISGQSANTEVIQKPAVNAQILEKRSFLRSLLQERSKNKLLGLSDISKETKGRNLSSEGPSKQVNKLTKGKQRYRNICRRCKKEFSTPANLMNHFQRHEALSGPWHKHFRERKLQKNHINSISLLRVMYRGSKLSRLRQRKKHVCLSETSLRLFLKYLDDMIPSCNRTKSVKQQNNETFQDKNKIYKHEKQGEFEPKKLQPIHVTKTENEALGKRFGLKRPSSVLSPKQTFIEATFKAEVDQENASSPTISSSSSLVLMKQQEAPVVSTTSRSPTFQTDLIETGSPGKKSRKSSRLATKKAKQHNKNPEEDTLSETAMAKNAATCENQSLLTNLNLLSTVSIEKALKETPSNNKNPQNVSNFIPAALSPKMKSRAAASSIPCCVSNPQQLLDTSDGNTLMINGFHEKKQCTDDVNVSSSSDLPFFVRSLKETSSVCPFPTQKLQDQPQSTSATSFLHPVDMDSNQLTSTLVAAPKTDTSPNNDCGAIDLSKPKLSQATANTPYNLEKTPDLTAPLGRSYNLPQFITNDYSPEVLQYLMMKAKTADLSSQGHNESQPVPAIVSNKQADSNHNTHLLASAHHSKIGKGIKNAPKVQAVIATSSSLTLPGKGVNSGGSSAMQGDEINCGYKWSGSGGLVKERTQMVRELVPLHVMENFLSKPWSATTVAHPVSVNVSVTSKSPLISWSGQPTSNKSHDLSESQPALNLTTSKSGEISDLNKGNLGRPRTYVPNLVITPSTPVGNSTPASPGFSGISSLKSHLTNLSRTENHVNACNPVLTNILDHSTISDRNNFQNKVINVSQSSSLLVSSVSTTSSSCTISSPSLAAMLAQPASSVHEIGYGNISGNAYRSVASPILSTNLSNSDHSSVLSSSYVKTEPFELLNTDQGMTEISLPIKTEKWDPDTDRVESSASQDDDSLHGNLVMDISLDSITSKVTKKTLTLGSHPTSAAASTNTSVKCDH